MQLMAMTTFAAILILLPLAFTTGHATVAGCGDHRLSGSAIAAGAVGKQHPNENA